MKTCRCRSDILGNVESQWELHSSPPEILSFWTTDNTPSRERDCFRTLYLIRPLQLRKVAKLGVTSPLMIREERCLAATAIECRSHYALKCSLFLVHVTFLRCSARRIFLHDSKGERGGIRRVVSPSFKVGDLDGVQPLNLSGWDGRGRTRWRRRRAD